MVLHEKQIDSDTYEVDLSNKSKEFLSLSPYGKVPVLVVNGTALYVSNVINEYLDEVYEAPRLIRKIPNSEPWRVHGCHMRTTTSFRPSSWLV